MPVSFSAHLVRSQEIFLQLQVVFPTTGNALFSIAGMVPMIIGLILTPILVSKFGIYKVNFYGMVLSVIFGIPGTIFGYAGNLPMFLVFTALRGLASSPMLGTLNAVIAATAEYSYNKDHVHLDGTMFSCSSMGI